MFIHGGYWRALQPSAFSQVAAGLNGHGVTVALVGYDLCPQVSISRIVEEIQQACVFLWKRYRKRLLVHGHSAGGHLTGCCFATDWEKFGAPKDLVPAAMGISGLYDLAPMVETAMNADFKLDAAEARRVSPLYLAGAVRKEYSTLSWAARSRMNFSARAEPLRRRGGKPASRHATRRLPGPTISPSSSHLADPNSAMVKRLLELLPKN